MKFLKRLFSRTPAEPIPAKSPTDYIYTPLNSTTWSYENYCTQCKAGRVNHQEFMAGICLSCGCYERFKSRSFRKIYNGSMWVFHYRLNNYSADDIISERQL